MSILGGIINAFDGSGDTVIVIPATSAAAYEPYYLLSQIKTVDGSGSDLDADLLDGYHAAHFGTAAQVQTLQNVDVSLQSQINNLFAVGSRLVYRENFTGNGVSTNFVLTGALQNAGYTTGSWSAANVLTALQADATDLNGKPIFDSVIPIYRDRINVSTIDSFGNVTLDFIPQAGQQFSIWYWYQLTSSDVLSYYYREDHVAEMEADGVQTASQVDTFTSAFGNIVLRTTDNTVQKALDRLDDYLETQSMSGSEDLRLRNEVIAISGDLQAQINSINVVGGTNVSVVEGPTNTFTISVSGNIGGGTGDITWAEVALVTGGLQNQIDAIVEESTTISSSGASIVVTQNGNNFNLEVASAPVSNHNSLLGLQGGSSGQYYHLTATEYASISGNSGSFVPYTGATSDVNLGNHKVTLDSIVLNNASVVSAPRQISWNEDDKTFNMGLTTEVTLQVGQEELIRVYNGTGSDILNGQPVYISGYDPEDDPMVSLAGATLAGNGTFVVGVATDTIPTGSHGFATVRGKVRGLDTSSYVSGQQIYLGETPGTFTTDISGFALSSHINSIGYIGLVDAISGSLYITIDNEQTLLSLSSAESNILAGNASSTGVYEYTGLTIATSASFTVPPLKGIVVDNTGVYATAPHITNVVFAGGTYPVTNILTDIATYVLINRAGVISQQVTHPTPEQRRDNIFLGKISHQNKSSITVINNTSDYDVAPLSALRDMFAPIAVLNEGILPYADGANLSFNKSAGSIYGMGINWVNNNKSPNKITFVGSLPTTFDYYTQTAVFAASQTLVTPGFYDLAGTRTAISATGDGGGNRSTNIRVYQFISGRVAVQYGQTVYSSLANAVASTQTESFVKYPALLGSTVLIGIISVRRTATVLNDTAYAIFTPASIFGEATGGTAGLSTTTLQQAYDNSTTPEIVINATLDGLTIKNGTGNADNVTHLLEGQNTAGTVTSFIMADGTFKSAYSVVDSISGASGSIVIHDATGKLLDSGFTIADISDGSDLSSYTPLSTTSSISGDLQVQINNCLTNETGVEFLVDSFNNGGIEYGGGNTSTWGSLTTATIIGNSSGATAEIRSTTGTTSGFLSLTTIVGDFIVGETITSSNGKTVTVVDFKKQMVSVERILNTTSNKDVFLYGAPWGLNESIKTLSSAPNQIFWAGQNASWLFASTSFNSDISIQKEYRGALLTTKSITLGWEGGNAELNVGGTNIIRVVNSITNLNNNPIAIGNTTDATNLLTGSLRVAGGMSSQKSIRGASIYAVDISGSSGNIVTHDADGKLLDSGILTTDLTLLTTSASISGDLQVQINSKANSSDLSNYTLLTTTASISGDFEVRINSLEVTKEDTNEPNGFINRTDSTLYYDATTATFAISGNYAVYLGGNKFLKTGDSATLTPAYGTQYIYYVYNTGDFTVSPTLFNIAKDAPVAYVFFNDGATDSFLAEERHGITMDGVTHQYLHRTVGSKYVSGMMLGDYILNSDTVANNKYSISEGTFYDEDILNEIPALPDNGPYNIFYRTGASGNWTWSKTQAYPYLINANSIRYNQFTGGSWQLTDITTSNRWVNYYVFATNAITPGFEYIIIPGQAIYTSLTLAKGESVANLSLGNLPFAEIVPVARVTHQFSTGYATANGRARIVAVASLTATSFVSAIATASNHNSLSGLQGGVAGEYYHLTSTEYDDLIGSTEVASISGDLQSQISGITIPTSATFLSDYDNRYVNISGDTMTGRLLVSDTTEATTLSDGSIQTDGGMSVTKTVVATDYKLSNGNSLTRHEDNLFVEAPTNKTYTVVAKANIPRTLTSINGLKTLVGTCTVAIHINGTPVTFTGSVTTISVTSTPQDVAIISGGTVASDARITCVITSVAGASDIEFTLAGTRT